MPVGMTNVARSRCRSSRERVVDGAAGRGLALLPDATRQIGLGIEVNEQDGLVRHRERGGEIDGGRGFGDAALLVGDGDDARIVCHLTNYVHLRSLLDCPCDCYAGQGKTARNVPRGTLRPQKDKRFHGSGFIVQFRFWRRSRASQRAREQWTRNRRTRNGEPGTWNAAAGAIRRAPATVLSKKPRVSFQSPSSVRVAAKENPDCLLIGSSPRARTRVRARPDARGVRQRPKELRPPERPGAISSRPWRRALRSASSSRRVVSTDASGQPELPDGFAQKR